MAKIVIFGIGQIAELAHYYFTKDTNHTVVAFTVDQDYMDKETFIELPVVPFESVENDYPPEHYHMFIALSYAKVNQLRAQKYVEAKEKGYSCLSYISSKATIFDQKAIGENCFILEDNTIQPFVKIGDNVTLWSGNHIGHHSVIKDNCFITSHVVISGGVIVEPYCFIGVNATLRDHINIAPSTVIGAGSLITRDTEENGVYKTRKTELSSIPSHKLKGF